VQALDALGLHLGRLAAVGQQALQVAAGAEHAALAGDDDAAHLGCLSAALSASTPAA
jgi:hypothetical protein